MRKFAHVVTAAFCRRNAVGVAGKRTSRILAAHCNVDRGARLCVALVELAEVVSMIESIIVYTLLLWGCWLAAQSLTPEGNT